MKLLYTIIFMMIAAVAYCSPHKVPEQLVTLNHCWTEQNDIAKLRYPQQTDLTDRQWIKVHLQLVEQTLRARPTAYLTKQQKANRLKALDELNSYWHSGSFPINDEYNYRTPIFIDKYDNFCAVGYLVKATGYEHVSRKIAAQTNLAYVREMNYPELNQWAQEYGFTVDELAWIQPTYVYVPTGVVHEIGKGADGEINELYVDKVGDRLYVGGNFSNVDSTITAAGVAYITDSNSVYTWHKLGDGVNGKVYAITEFDNKVFVAGNFSKSGPTDLYNIAYWNGNSWIAAGCLDGVVKDLAVFNNELYACGDFGTCGGNQEVNFAKWTGTSWQGISGLTGTVNVMYVNGSELILGGLFDYGNSNVNIVKWYPQFGFVKYSNDIVNEVNDIQKYKGTFLVATRATQSASQMLYKSSGTALWVDVNYMWAFPNPSIPSYNTICVEEDTIWMGGDFYQMPPMPPFGGSYHYTYSQNITYEVTENISLHGYNSFYIDGPVNKFAVFKGALIGAGSFSKTYKGNKTINNMFRKAKKKVVIPPPPPTPTITIYPWMDSDFNSTGTINDKLTGIGEVQSEEKHLTIYPNPASGSITVTNNFNANYFKLTDLSGRVVMSQKIAEATTTIQLQGVAPGIYMAEVTTLDGMKMVRRITVE